MQYPDKYWEGIYWEGLSPQSVDAVPLEGVECGDDKDLAAIVRSCVHYIEAKRDQAPSRKTSQASSSCSKEGKSAVDDVDIDSVGSENYFITIQDIPIAKPTKRAEVEEALRRSLHCNDVVLVSNPQLIRCLLWHVKVFLGARVSLLSVYSFSTLT